MALNRPQIPLRSICAASLYRFGLLGRVTLIPTTDATWRVGEKRFPFGAGV